jgi:hypothetical protein
MAIDTFLLHIYAIFLDRNHQSMRYELAGKLECSSGKAQDLRTRLSVTLETARRHGKWDCDGHHFATTFGRTWVRVEAIEHLTNLDAEHSSKTTDNRDLWGLRHAHRRLRRDY